MIEEISQKTTSKWSGGTTTEIYKYPPSAAFLSADFQYRFSLAEIIEENSVFTKIPTVKRTFFLLKGKVELRHENHHQSVLLANEQDHFDGDWNTVCQGKGTVFNLMTRPDISSTISHFKLKANEKMKLTETQHGELVFIYLADGQIKASDNSQTIMMKQNSFIRLSETAIDLHALEASRLIITKITSPSPTKK